MMIKKLSEYKITKRDGDYINADNNTQIINTLVCKINELVDVVNELQQGLEEHDNEIDDCAKEMAIHLDQISELQEQVKKIDQNLNFEQPEVKEFDLYAEQRKWVGKLCWYKLCEGDTWKVGRLEKIQENADAGYPFVFDGLCYKICEPVKPDDDIIFKGE